MAQPKSLGAPSFAEKYQVAFCNTKISSAIFISCNPLSFLVDTHIYSFSPKLLPWLVYRWLWCISQQPRHKVIVGFLWRHPSWEATKRTYISIRLCFFWQQPLRLSLSTAFLAWSKRHTYISFGTKAFFKRPSCIFWSFTLPRTSAECRSCRQYFKS